MDLQNISQQIRKTAMLRGFGLFKVPLIAFLSPSVIHLDRHKCVIKIPLGYRSRNHWRSMYFGALAVGADTAIGLLAMECINQTGDNIGLIFKDFSIQFFKRAESDVHFICEQGAEVAQLVAQAQASGERVNASIKGYAIAPKATGDTPVAEYSLTLSLKKKN